MQEDNIFLKMDREYYQLTSSEKKIADCLTLHQGEGLLQSITELASEAGVAEATVSRFCRRMGFASYNAFKLAVASAAGGRGVYSPLSGEVLPEDSVEEMCQKIYQADVAGVKQSMELVRPEAVQAAAELLLSAEKVLCMGQGGSMILAEEAAYLFSTAMPNFFPVDNSHVQATRAAMLGPKDVVLYFSYSGSTKEVIELLRTVRQREAKSILMTRFPRSPGAMYADVVLECGAREGPLQLGSIAGRMAQLFLVDVLFSEVCRRDIEGCKARRKLVADALAEKHV